MSSLTQALSIALSGLNTTTALLTLASQNVSNAQTSGYTEKTASVTTSSDGGSTIASYGRATDAALSNNYNMATSEASYYSTLNGYMTQVQSILDSTSSNPTLTTDISNFSSAWTAYSADPSDSVEQQAVISAGQTLAQDVNTIATEVGSLGSQVESDTQTSIKSLNTDLQQIAQLNDQIQSATAAGQQTGDLEDERDTLINTVSTYVGVNVQSRANGQVAVYTTSGQLLVDSGVAMQFSYDGTNVKDSNGVVVNSSLTGGSIEAELDFQDTSASALSSAIPGVGTLGKLQSQLSTLVSALTSSTSNFASSYSSAATASTANGASQNGSTVDTSFFTVSNNPDGTPDATSFAVNADIISGDSELPETDTQSVANSFTATSTYTASGLSATNVTYAQLGSAILSGFQQAANSISSENTSASTTQSYYQTALSDATGVNIDDELTKMVAYQSSYAASAHVITTVSNMLTTLMDTIT